MARNPLVAMLLLLPLTAVAGVRVYDVAPYANVYDTVTHDGNVDQTFVAVSDSLLWVCL